MSADLPRLFFLAAPFTLLVAVAVEVLGPPAPVDLSAITPPQLLWRLAVPSIMAALAQLAISHLVLHPDSTPRMALSAAAALFPAYIVAQMLAAFPIGVGFVVLLIPGLYLFARLVFLAGAVAVTRRGSPMAILKGSWAVSAGQALPLCLFLLMMLFAVIGISLLAQGAGSAVDVIARLIGLGFAGHFLHALVAGIGSCLITVGTAIAGAVAYRLLVARC